MAMNWNADGRVLIVEDDRPTSKLIVMALQSTEMEIDCREVRTAEEALAFLKNTHGTARTPDLVLLDLDLPGIDGFELLDRLEEEPALGSLPVVVLSRYASPATIDRCYDHHARSFFEKPDAWKEFLAMAETIRGTWIGPAPAASDAPRARKAEPPN